MFVEAGENTAASMAHFRLPENYHNLVSDFSKPKKDHNAFLGSESTHGGEESVGGGCGGGCEKLTVAAVGENHAVESF